MGRGNSVNGIYMPSLEVESRRPWKDELVVIAAIYLVQSPTYWGRESSPKGLSQGHTAGRSRARAQLKCLLPFREITTQGQPYNRPCCFGGL